MAAVPEIMTLWDERANFEAPALSYPGHAWACCDKPSSSNTSTRAAADWNDLRRYYYCATTSSWISLAGRRGSGNNMVGLAAEETASLVVRGNHVEALGDANSHIFLKSADVARSLGINVAWRSGCD